MSKVVKASKLPMELQVPAPPFEAKHCVGNYSDDKVNVEIPCRLVKAGKRGNSHCTVSLQPGVKRMKRRSKRRGLGNLSFTFRSNSDEMITIDYMDDFEFVLDIAEDDTQTFAQEQSLDT